MAVLIAQLLDKGILDTKDIADMSRRLEEGGDERFLGDLLGIVMSCEIDTPANRRAGIHSIDGGKTKD